MFKEFFSYSFKKSFIKILFLTTLLCVFFAACSENAQAADLKMSAEEFIELCGNGTLQEIEAAIKDRADVNAKAKWNGVTCTSLIAAVSNNQLNIVQFLIDNGADVNEKVDFGYTALMIAALRRDPEIVSLLIKAGADVNAKTKMNDETRSADVPEGLSDKTAIMIASERGFFDIVEILSQSGAGEYELSVENFIELCANGTLQQVEAAIKKMADINAKANWNGASCTSLIAAVSNNQLNVIQLLIDNGADVNEKVVFGYTALMIAALRHDPEIVSLLIKAGADVNARTKMDDEARSANMPEELSDKTAIMLASEKGYFDIVEILSQSGADEYELSSENFIELCASGTLQQVEAAIKKIADVNVKAKWNGATCTSLIAAVSKNNPNVVQLLIDNGANINDKGVYGFTALIIATLQRKPEMVSLLISAGADVNAKTMMNDEAKAAEMPEEFSDKTALMIASEKGFFDIVDILTQSGAENEISAERFISLCANGTLQEVGDAIKSGININEKAKFEGATCTSLIAAISYNKSDVAQLLLDNGVDVNGRGMCGLTALMIAALKRNPDMVTLLIKSGADVNLRTEMDDEARAVGLPEIFSDKSAVMFATDEGFDDIVELLTKSSADVK